MALNDPIKEITLRLKRETTSKVTKLMRMVERDPETGQLVVRFPIDIEAEAITYELDASDVKTDIYEIEQLGRFSLSDAEVMNLWTELVTLSDGSTKMLGNVLADKIDEILALHFPTPP